MNIHHATTSAHSITESVQSLRSTFQRGKTRSLAYRVEQLDGIAEFMRRCNKDIEEAIYQDLRRPSLETFSSDIATTLTELR